MPGAVASWVALSQRFGKLPFGDLLAPAIDIAERGYLVPVVVAEKWMLAAQVADLVSQPGFAQTFLPHGPRAGASCSAPAPARGPWQEGGREAGLRHQVGHLRGQHHSRHHHRHR